MRHLAFSSGMIIVAAALCAAAAQAQNEGMGVPRPGVTRPDMPPPREAPDAWCRTENAYRLSAIDQVVCADRTLVNKHIRVADLQWSLQRAAGFPRTLRLEQLHKTWLQDRAQCAGADVTACLDRLYDARMRELADAIVMERQGKQRHRAPALDAARTRVPGAAQRRRLLPALVRCPPSPRLWRACSLARRSFSEGGCRPGTVTVRGDPGSVVPPRLAPMGSSPSTGVDGPVSARENRRRAVDRSPADAVGKVSRGLMRVGQEDQGSRCIRSLEAGFRSGFCRRPGRQNMISSSSSIGWSSRSSCLLRCGCLCSTSSRAGGTATCIISSRMNGRIGPQGLVGGCDQQNGPARQRHAMGHSGSSPRIKSGTRCSCQSFSTCARATDWLSNRSYNHRELSIGSD